LKLERADGFASLYANNIRFEPSVWDLKFIFGEIDQSKGEFVEQHTAITVPWAQAKVMAYFLAVNTILHQFQTGSIIQTPDSIKPPRPDPSDPAVAAEAKPIFEYLAWIHEQFFGPHPYTPPSVDSPKL
jgi:hypothetical protein